MSKLGIFKNKLFLACVFFPTLIAGIYYGLIASDIYISQSSFVVRTPEKQGGSSLLGTVLKNTGFTRSQDDAYTVEDYILSRDAMNLLNKKLNIKSKFSDKSIDLFSRFDGIYPDDSFEAFYLYYRKMIDVKLDANSSIITLKTKAFDANDAKAIDEYLLELSEQLVNKLNERAQTEVVRAAQETVDKAEAKAKAAALALGEYRNRVGVIDPERQSTIPLEQIAKLQDQLLAIRSQIMQVETISKNNPQLPVLRKRADMLKQAIQQQTEGVAGSQDGSLASKAIEYQRLSLDNQFADRELVNAMASLQQARTEAQRQQLFLERISQPSLPDEGTEPKRFRMVLAVFIFGLVLWGILTMLMAGIREHQD